MNIEIFVSVKESIGEIQEFESDDVEIKEETKE